LRKPGALLAVVSDSYDIFNATEKLWGEELRQQVIDSGATLVVRPDSGHPATIVTQLAKILDSKFGSEVNEKGFKVLNNVRIIQGDGINADSVQEILETLIGAGFSADNIAFGMGGALLGAPQRDDQKFALKCSAALIDGTWVDVYKDPITDPGKTSKKGRLGLICQCGVGSCGFNTVPEDVAEKVGNVLQTVYEDGQLIVDDSFSAIRNRAELKEEDFRDVELADRF
jgi:nicotinamide phosphoribosyltransferase